MIGYPDWEGETMNETLLRYLPVSAADALRRADSLCGQSADEIRMYVGGNIVCVAGGRNIRTSVVCTEEILRITVENLCGHSLYAHEESLRQGYIITAEGIRAGVAGRVIHSGDNIERITDFTSLCLRVPRRFPGVSDAICSYATADGLTSSVLIFSPPGVGKTTALREMADQLTKQHYRVALIDTRYELGYGIGGDFLDVFKGYPRSTGMEMAVRVMNPQFVICDEIFSEADANAVLQCASAGVAVVASAHGGSVEDLRRQRAINTLLERNVFRVLVQLHRKNGRIVYTFYTKRGGVWASADGGSSSVVVGGSSYHYPTAER